MSAQRWLAGLVLLSACGSLRMGPSEDRVYTLYTNSIIVYERTHIATFDADQSDPQYNAINCDVIQERENRMAIAEGRPIKYWCEKGYYRP
jgi:hypothetical protein